MELNKNILLLALQNLREQVECTEAPFLENKLKEIDEQVHMIRETLSPSITGRDLAWKIVTTLRGHYFKDMSLEEVDEFRSEISKLLFLKKED